MTSNFEGLWIRPSGNKLRMGVGEGMGGSTGMLQTPGRVARDPPPPSCNFPPLATPWVRYARVTDDGNP